LKEFRVIQIIDSLSVGGAEMVAVNIANALSEQKIKSFLCTTRKEGLLKNNLNDDVKYIFLDRKKTFDLKAIIKLNNFIKLNKINIIHAHSSSYFIAVCVKLINFKVKIIWHDHNGNSEFLKNRNSFPLNVFSLFFSSIIAVNRQLKIWTTKKLYCKKVYFINNFAVFSNSDKTSKLKGTPGKRIINLAGFREQKDHLTLLKAFKMLLIQFPDWTLHLVGKDYKDDYANSISNYITSNNLSDNIFIYDVRSDIKHILSQATIGILSSKSEGLPVSLLEYGLAKLPVVCTDVGACASVIKHESSGYIVPPENYEKLAFYLTKLATSKENQIKFGINLNEIVKLNYSKEVVIKSIINIYSNCLPT